VRRLHGILVEESAKEKLGRAEGGSALFHQWVPRFLKERYTNPGTIQSWAVMWFKMSGFLTEKKVTHPAEVTYHLMMDYLRWRVSPPKGSKRRPVSRNTAIEEISRMGLLMQEALRNGWVIANPCMRMGLRRDPSKKEKRAITKKEEARIFKELKECEHGEWDGWMSEMFLVAMRQGCRKNEVKVPLENIDVEAMKITFKIKRGRTHVSPLHKDLLPLVKKARKEKRKVLVSVPDCASVKWLATGCIESSWRRALTWNSSQVERNEWAILTDALPPGMRKP
jgi:site-specific recombinase XerD